MAESSDTPLRKGKNDYEEYFNPAVYLGQYYKTPQGNPEEPGFLQFAIDTLYKVYSSGDIKGECIVDIGSGPNIHNLIPAAKYFNKIVLTDIAESNRSEVKKWLNKDPTAHDWEPFFRYQADNEGQTDWEERQEDFRKKVEKVLPCNVLHMNPLYPESLDPVDAVSTCLCLETTCEDITHYRQTMKNVSSLIKTGGHFVIVGVLNETYYNVGEERFYCLSLTADEIKSAMADAGLDDITWYEQANKSDETLSDYLGAFVAVAVKKAT